jgi:hypothetical protein
MEITVPDTLAWYRLRTPVFPVGTALAPSPS